MMQIWSYGASKQWAILFFPADVEISWVNELISDFQVVGT